MLKKDITYTDFDGNQQTETFYFNFTKAELVRMMTEGEGETETIQDRLIRIGKSSDKAEILMEFERFVLNSYGERSADGKRFVKSPEISEGFKQHAAYDELLFSFFEGDTASSDFINGIMPKDLIESVDKQLATGKTPEQIVRENSEANMQGHLTKRPPVPTEDDEKALQRAELQRQLDELSK